MKASRFVVITLLMVIVSITGAGCTGKPKDTLTIFHAGSLSVPFADLERVFEQSYPDVEVERESAGSRSTIRKVTELGKQADVIASADYAAIEQLMFPEYADWHISFARNQMVLTYTDSSRYADEINKDNWYEVLTRDEVETGRADPNADPCGYRTLLVWQLAEAYYEITGLYADLEAHSPPGNIRPKEVDLIALLQSGDLDYAWEYRSIAEQHGLQFLELPPEIDLSDIAYRDFYATASVEIDGTEPGTTQTQIGEPIIYAVTIPKNALHPELALEWVKLLLGSEGQAVMADNGQLPIVPAVASDKARIPDELIEFVAD